MSTSLDRRSRKRLANRDVIARAADRLFFEKGFENVTIDEIAAAADVGRMTVFNHFPKKEDMFFDRDAEGRELLREALRERDPTVTPIETLGRLAHRLAESESPIVQFSAGSRVFIQTVEASATLRARAREIRDELAQVLAISLAESVGREAGDPDAQLAAGILLGVWTAALLAAHSAYRRGGNATEATAVFLSAVDRGTRGLMAAMAGTPYASSTPRLPHGP